MNLGELFNKAEKLTKFSQEEALFLINTPDNKLEEFFNYANSLREKYFGNKVMLCGIVNAKSGKCSENCSFCAQSAHHQTNAEVYPLLNEEDLLGAALQAKKSGVGCFSLVTSGRGVVNNQDFEILKNTVKKIKDLGGMRRCVSLGILSKAQAQELKDAGLTKYHHNLETAESFFPEMCTTHTYAERVETIKNVKAAGLKACCGGIFGLGETAKQRVELGLAIRDLDVDSVPINILHPIPGTKIYGKVEPLAINDILRLIATYRFLMPDKTIGVFGGREYHLQDQQIKIFQAGANSILIGNYLTTNGAVPEKDLNLLKQAGLEPVYDC